MAPAHVSVLSYDRRVLASCTEDVLDRSLLETILTLLREQPEPGVVTDDATTSPAPPMAYPTPQH